MTVTCSLDNLLLTFLLGKINNINIKLAATIDTESFYFVF